MELLKRGSPLPLGPSWGPTGLNLALFSEHATSVTLVAFDPKTLQPRMELALDPRVHRTGNVWHALLKGARGDFVYGFKLDGPPEPRSGRRSYDPERVVLDPRAPVVLSASGNGGRPRRLCMAPRDDFDWKGDVPINRRLDETVIYEVHLKGFTKHPSSGVSKPGTYAGFIEKIPYLVDLGITAVELMPIAEFDDGPLDRRDPSTGRVLTNYWGYDPISFFAPKASYAAHREGARHLAELREMIRQLHLAGIEVILDVVFNHTGEGNEQGPVISFKGIDEQVYYILDPHNGAYHNYSGCGNTVNCNHPVVRDMILDALRYWVTEMHVDGFRFDLASILGRGRSGEVLPDPPLIERIAADPVLADTKLIAEAWDAAGLYQVGSFPAWGRWAEWNGRFRDDIRRFVRGDEGLLGAAATRLYGSSDLYQHSGRAPFHSINFVTSHDGFTLWDLVSYNTKHNEANGEDNRDGANENYSWNCGTEGETRDPAVLKLRQKQVRNFMLILLASRGVPMILGGDEFLRTQRGNNNAYCQDNEISWFDWDLARANEWMVRFTKLLVAFRKRHQVLRSTAYRCESKRCGVEWYGPDLRPPAWDSERLLCMHLWDEREDVLLILNPQPRDVLVKLPMPNRGCGWLLVCDTAAQPPADIYEEGREPPLESLGRWVNSEERLACDSHSCMLLRSR